MIDAYRDIRHVATVTRVCLERVWPSWRHINRCPEAADGCISYETCIPSSFTLRNVLQETVRDWNWHVCGGRPTKRTPHGGVWFAADRGGSHLWVEGRRRPGHIVTVDITADQFGGPCVLIEANGSPFHVSNATRPLLQYYQSREERTIENWVNIVLFAMQSEN